MAPGGVHHHSPTGNLHAIVSPRVGRHNGIMNLTPQQQTRTTREPQANCALAMALGNLRYDYRRAW